jgi:sterol desaturase/sphingolipid hydroxylase (fatty acid hydroxylase superfamily)
VRDLRAVAQKPLKIRPDSPPALQLVIEFLCSVRSVAVFSTVSLLSFVMWKAGWLWGDAWREHAGPVWIVVSFVITVVAHDAYFYWAHRIMHHPRLFRTFHRRHHRSHNPTPFTAYSFDLAEAAVMASFTVIWELLVPVSWVGFTAFLIHQIARNVIGHSGYELFPARRDGRPLFDWMTTVTHHDLHHSPGRLELRPVLHLVGPVDGHRAPGIPRAVRGGRPRPASPRWRRRNRKRGGGSLRLPSFRSGRERTYQPHFSPLFCFTSQMFSGLK